MFTVTRIQPPSSTLRSWLDEGENTGTCWFHSFAHLSPKWTDNFIIVLEINWASLFTHQNHCLHPIQGRQNYEPAVFLLRQVDTWKPLIQLQKQWEEQQAQGTEVLSEKKYSYVMVKTDCQLDRVKNHPRGNSLGIFVRKFLDWIDQGSETNSNCGYHQGKGNRELTISTNLHLHVDCRCNVSSQAFLHAFSTAMIWSESKPTLPCDLS